MTSLSPEHSLPCEPHCADSAAAVIASEVLVYRAFPQLWGGADIRNAFLPVFSPWPGFL